jgi:hypothetical protein
VKSRTFVIGFFAVVALVAAASIYLRLTVDRAEKDIAAVTAPDGKLKAVRVTLSNGAPAPFCNETVVVILALYPDEFDENRNLYEVYAGRCGAKPLEVRWVSDRELRIVSSGAVMRSKDTDATKTVKVTLVRP